MGVNNLPKTVTRQRRGCDLNQGPSAPESSTLTTRLPSHPSNSRTDYKTKSSNVFTYGVATVTTLQITLTYTRPPMFDRLQRRHNSHGLLLNSQRRAVPLPPAVLLLITPSK